MSDGQMATEEIGIEADKLWRKLFAAEAKIKELEAALRVIADLNTNLSHTDTRTALWDAKSRAREAMRNSK